MRGSATKRRRRVGARGAIPLALLCLVVQLSSAAHFVLTTHSICPEHGEAVDGDPGAAHHHDAAPIERATTTAVSSTAGHTPTGAHEHEHCLVVSDRRNDALLRPPAPRVEPLASSRAEPSATDHARGLRSIPLLFVAPKSSPPTCVVV